MDNQHPSSYHYVYLVSDGIKSYVGVRSSSIEPDKDPYMGSYSDKFFIPNKKYILKTFPNRELAFEYEVNLHENWKVDKWDVFINRAKAAKDEGFKTPFGYKWNLENKKRFSELKKKNPTILSKEAIDSMSLSLSLKSSNGLFRESIKIRKKNRFSKREIFHLYHVSGLIYSGSFQSFIDLFDVTYSGTSELIKGSIKVHRGWKRFNDQSESS